MSPEGRSFLGCLAIVVVIVLLVVGVAYLSKDPPETPLPTPTRRPSVEATELPKTVTPPITPPPPTVTVPDIPTDTPPEVANLLEEAYHCHAQGGYDDAQEMYEKVVEVGNCRQQQDQEFCRHAWYADAGIYQLESNRKEAAERYRLVVESFPCYDRGEALRQLATCLRDEAHELLSGNAVSGTGQVLRQIPDPSQNTSAMELFCEALNYVDQSMQPDCYDALKPHKNANFGYYLKASLLFNTCDYSGAIESADLFLANCGNDDFWCEPRAQKEIGELRQTALGMRDSPPPEGCGCP